ncbi:hypothetical protein [Desulfomonile tiedjei]|uniref:Uncharacterized protein n=1 Tax=Desulfomonile tiedjei (strain ATCC 49306 / DSM 6799 / DCB-1) TaxID=706587 RepID=I4C1I7_DESTA|nr:hypothetical protein [Desulfomonile tiedjei]AFM23428.1 hypothetical protein Desti_0702 [Desulfomonile tiedjei DSM 6799]
MTISVAFFLSPAGDIARMPLILFCIQDANYTDLAPQVSGTPVPRLTAVLGATDLPCRSVLPLQ